MIRFFAALLVVMTFACAPVARDPTCDAAEACDKALDEPFGDFASTDPVFGDDLNGDGTVGVDLADVGTCWQNDTTAAPCINSCKAFIAEQQAIATEQGNAAVIAACGGAAQ